MNNIDLTPFLEKISFVKKYTSICENYNDFENRLRGNNIELYESVFKQLNYKYKYFKRESFYRVSITENNFYFELNLVLKDGLVEAILNIKFKNQYFFPNGRLDFIPKKMKKDFDRKKFNLPKYSSKEDLQQILKSILLIYEDIQKSVIDIDFS